MKIKCILLGCFMCLIVSALMADPVYVENWSFELPGGGKIDDFVDVPGWTQDVPHTEKTDSGVETGDGVVQFPYDGDWRAFIRGYDGPIYQVIDRAILDCEVYTLTFAGTNTGSAQYLTATLFYLDDPDDESTRIPIESEEFGPNSYEIWDIFTIECAIEAGHPCVGKKIGIQFTNSSGDWTWAGVDAVQLDAVPGPPMAGSADPANHSVHIDPDIDLSWSIPDALSTSTTSTVHFGVDPNAWDITYSAGTSTVYDPGTLNYNMQYYWQVDLTDGGTVYPGIIWDFTTGGKATDPVPADGGFGALPTTTVSWTGDDFITSYKVYAGTSLPLTEVDEVTDTQCDIPTPDDTTTYYWRVDTYIGTDLILTGDTWSFITPGLIGYWMLNDTIVPGVEGVAVDSSLFGNDGIVSDTGMTSVDGMFEGGFHFAGFDVVVNPDYGSHVEIPPLNLNTNSMTISAWVKREGSQLSYSGIVFSRAGSTVAGLHFGEANELRYSWNDASDTWSWDSGLVTADNEWFHAVLVLEPDQATIYLNGTGAVNEVTHNIEEFDGVTYMGRDWANGRSFVGIMDDVRIYNRALTESEVMSIFEEACFATDPIPENRATGVAPDVVLQWTPDPDALAHDVYFGLADDPNWAQTPVATGLGATANSYDPTPSGDLLALNTQYNWRVDTTNSEGTLTGSYWTFTTISDLANSPVPADGATGVDPGIVLEWQPGWGGPYTYDVYFGTGAASLVQVASDQAETTFDPLGVDELEWSTRYYWRIDERQGGVVVHTGDIWDFSTITPQCDPEAPLAADVNGDCVVNILDFAEVAIGWMSCNYTPQEACP